MRVINFDRGSERRPCQKGSERRLRQRGSQRKLRQIRWRPLEIASLFMISLLAVAITALALYWEISRTSIEPQNPALARLSEESLPRTAKNLLQSGDALTRRQDYLGGP